MDRKITLTINADGSAAITEIEAAKKSVEGIGPAAQKAGREGARGMGLLQTAAEHVDGIIGKVGKSILGLQALSAGAMVAMARQAVNVADETAKLSQRLGIATEDISALRHAAELGGSSLQELGGGLAILARNAQSAADGNKSALASFEKLGITATDAHGRARPLYDLLGDIAERFQGMPDGPEKTAAAMDVLGRAGAALIPTLNGGRDGLAAMRAEAEALGTVIDGETARAAEQFNDNLSRLQRGMQGLAMDVARELLPAMINVTEAMVDWFKSIREDGTLQRWGERIKWLLGLLDELAVFLIARFAAVAIAGAVFSIGSFITAVSAAGGAMAKLNAVMAANAFGIAAAAIGLVVVAIYKMVTATTEAERVKQLYAEAVRNATDQVNALRGATRDQIEEQLRQIASTRGLIQQQLDLAEANLAVAESEAEIASQRAAARGGGRGGRPDRGWGGAADRAQIDAVAAGVDMAKAASRVEELRLKLFETDETYRQLIEELNRPALESPTLRNFTQEAEDAKKALKDKAETTRLVAQATSEAERAYRAYIEQFDPMLALELQHADALEKIEHWHALGAISAQRYGELKALANRSSAQSVAALTKERDILGRLNTEHQEQVRMLGMTRRELSGHQAALRAVAMAQAAWGDKLADMPGYLDGVAEHARQLDGELFDSTETAQALEAILSRFDDIGMGGLTGEIAMVKAALEDATDPAIIARLQNALGNLRQQGLETMVGASQQVLRSMQSMAKEGSSAYRNMEIASQALNVALAIGAILNQGKGDPYTAFARMAAMAAAVAGLVGSIDANFGGGFSDTAGQRQATQGTGTVLGDREAQSESILRATQITADATSSLVGISRGMLRALVALQNGIGAATGMLARGAANTDFAWPGDTALNEIGWGRFLSRLGDPIFGTGLLGRFLGGSSSITDSGIMLGGGGLGDLNARAYQEQQYRQWRWGSTRTREQTAALPDDIANQFDLIIGSIVDTVREGALALGLLPEEIEAAIQSYQVAVQRISLDGLNADEQRQALEAVFSSMFDGLAGHVVQWLPQFQRVGEGLGETLVRVATSVQVVQESMRYLGLAIDETDPERLAQISVALVEAAGGIEEFISGMLNFVDKFAPESHRFATAQAALTDAFEQFGIALPATREAMWDLMQTLDPMTEAGAEQIAILLELTDTAHAYYTALERQKKAQQDYADFIDSFRPGEQIRGAVAELRQQEREAIARAHELARAAGMQAAAERDLAMIHRWAAGQVAGAILELQRRVSDLVRQLTAPGTFVPGQGYVEQEVESWRDSAVGAISDIGQATQQLYQQQLAGIQRLQDYLISMQFGGTSALSPMQQLDAARQQLEVLRLAALAGDPDAMNALPGAAQQFLQLLQGAYASGDEFGEGYEWVRALLQEVVDAGPTAAPGDTGGGVWNGYPGLTPDSLRERDAALAEQEAAYRAGLAEQLAQYLGEFAGALRVPVFELIEVMGYSLDQLVSDLGINLDEITGETVLALANLADLLGVRLTDLTGELGLELTDLGDGIRELLGRMGQSLDDITAETVTAMAGLASYLGLTLGELTAALGLELTDLGDGIRELLGEMGHSLDEITGGTVTAMAALADELGLTLGEMTTALGLELTDLAGGIGELAAQMGVDLSNLTVESTQALAALATRLGTDLGTLAIALGEDLGALTDSQSLLNQTFAAELASLPQRERDLLQPLFDAVTSATSEADANAAIGALESAVNRLSPDIRTQLAPYLSNVFPPDALSDLDHLSTISSRVGDMSWQLSGIDATLGSILSAVSANNGAQGVPGYAAGGWVDQRQLIMAGEAGRELILPNPVSEFLARNGIPVNVGGGGGMSPADMRAIIERLERIEARIAEADRNNSQATEQASRETTIALREASRERELTRS